MKEGRKPEYLEKTPGDELQKLPHFKTEDSNPKRDSNPHNSIGGRLGKQTCVCCGYLHRAINRPGFGMTIAKSNKHM